MRQAMLCAILLALFEPAPFAQDAVDQVIGEALNPSALESNLRRLTDEIGGRVPGTPAMHKAVDWGVAAFKAAGADSVHTEEFTIPTSWAEGATEVSVTAMGGSGSPLVPTSQFRVRAVSIAWAPALSAQHRVRVIDVGNGGAEDFAQASNLAGALLLVHSEEMKTWNDLFTEYLRAGGIVARAKVAKALAVAFQSTRPHDLLYRHTNSTEGELDQLPMVMVAREDAGRMSRLLASGQTVYADLAIPNRIGGAIQAANVIAEVRGSEKPDEFVILGAHLDSWELGTGALDNGCNAALVIDALRAIKTTGLRPRRSIRFILFSGEEEGMIGSRAYAVSHRGELDKVAAVVVFDAGVGRVTGFSLGGRKDLVEGTKTIAAPLQQFDAATLTTDNEWGTDNFDFMLEGVPTFIANQEESNYLINYHAMSDTFDKVDLAQLKKHVAEAAALTFGLANMPERIGPRLNHSQIEQTLRETHLDEQMRVLGLWDTWVNGKRGRAN
jgi:carboxypeptidase Q